MFSTIPGDQPGSALPQAAHGTAAASTIPSAIIFNARTLPVACTRTTVPLSAVKAAGSRPVTQSSSGWSSWQCQEIENRTEPCTRQLLRKSRAIRGATRFNSDARIGCALEIEAEPDTAGPWQDGMRVDVVDASARLTRQPGPTEVLDITVRRVARHSTA
jgi:hypothetical protein